MKFIVSRVDNKAKKHQITEVYADGYTIESYCVGEVPIPLNEIHFHTTRERLLREPVIGRISSMLVSGDVVIESV